MLQRGIKQRGVYVHRQMGCNFQQCVLGSVNLEDTFGQRPEGCRLSKHHEILGISSGEATANAPVFLTMCSVLEGRRGSRVATRE